MSIKYAESLRKGVDYGPCGAIEKYDSERVLAKKMAQLAELVRESGHCVVHTGAGISTACSIPDFRGPRGVWTLERAGEKLPPPSVLFVNAVPSLTHMAIVGLLRAGKVRYVISQNVDGLHLRSGVPMDRISELHGDVFIEKCHDCGAVYRRDFEIETVGLRPTGRTCEECHGALHDFTLDWDDALPEPAYTTAQEQSEAADLSLCLGTSLRISPANDLPVSTTRNGRGKLAVVNLQATGKERYASLHVYCTTDYAMKQLMAALDLPIPVYTVTQTVTVSHEWVEAEESKANGQRKTHCRVTVQVGDSARCPYLRSVGLQSPAGEQLLQQPPYVFLLPLPSHAASSVDVPAVAGSGPVKGEAHATPVCTGSLVAEAVPQPMPPGPAALPSATEAEGGGGTTAPAPPSALSGVPAAGGDGLLGPRCCPAAAAPPQTCGPGADTAPPAAATAASARATPVPSATGSAPEGQAMDGVAVDVDGAGQCAAREAPEALATGRWGPPALGGTPGPSPPVPTKGAAVPGAARAPGAAQLTVLLRFVEHCTCGPQALDCSAALASPKGQQRCDVTVVRRDYNAVDPEPRKPAEASPAPPVPPRGKRRVKTG